MKKYFFVLLSSLGLWQFAAAQQLDSLREANKKLDSLYIEEVEKKKNPVKILHAEPLYIDLIRDLGARKGEHEWNVGFGLTDNLKYDTYEALIEYEWAPADRLGLEVELPVTMVAQYKNGEPADGEVVPSSRVESIKMAMQWSFYVSEKHSTSMALGYIQEFEFSDFKNFGNPLFKGNVYNPFFIVAKRLGSNWHSLLYTGPSFEHHFATRTLSTTMEINSNIHYMISGTRNFIGIEFNKNATKTDFDMVIRPQMRVAVTDNFLIGIVGGIPVGREDQRFSMFTRVIWEPMNKPRKK